MESYVFREKGIPEPMFVTVPMLPQTPSRSLSLGVGEIDGLLGAPKLGNFIVFHGSRMSHILSEVLCVRSMLPFSEGGLDSSVILIDGGNIFDPYHISETSLTLDLNPEETLENIWVSRAFTAYQLTALITEELDKILERERSRLVVISDIASLYCDPDIGMSEAKNTFNRVTLFLQNLARQNDLIIMATSLSSPSRIKRRLEQYLFGRASTVAKVEGGNPHLTITLEKHPNKPLDSVELFLGHEDLSPQLVLEDFVEV